MRSVLVRTFDRTGQPAPHTRITVWQGGWVGGLLAAKETDAGGNAEFDLDLKDSDLIDLHANGKPMVTNGALRSEFRLVV